MMAISAPAWAQPSPSPAELDQIGHALIDAVGTPDARILFFGRFDDGFAAYAIRYIADGSTELRPAFFRRESDPHVTAVWTAARARLGENVWHELTYVLDHGRVRVALHYREQIDPAVDFDTAATAVEREFAGQARRPD
jgi:hypothetical protein